MLPRIHLNHSTIAAFGAAILFGASIPFAKIFVGVISPILLAGLLYLGSGIGLIIARLIINQGWKASGLVNYEWLWLLGSIGFGGLLAPVLLMIGLVTINAATASLFLNLEAVFTALLAWIFFKESTDRRIVFGMFLIVLGGIALSWQNPVSYQNFLGILAIAAACLAWAIDNNLTRKISSADSLFIAGSKGLSAGIINIILAVIVGDALPNLMHISYVLLIGFLGYGISLVLFVLALRGLGTGRTGAYFSTAPFMGAAIAIIFFHDATSILFWVAGGLMAIGLWIHLTEHHEHVHTHEYLFHSHRHVHDQHHQHLHNPAWDHKVPHTHPHEHPELTHSHRHYPDIHHRHHHNKKRDSKSS